MKRVSPLKHQPEDPHSDSEGKAPGNGEAPGNTGAPGSPGGAPGDTKEEPDKPGHAPSSEGPGGRGAEAPPLGAALLGELEHYDLDMDEILDVPYLKSSQQASTLPRPPAPRAPPPSGLGGTLDRKHGARRPGAGLHHEALSLAGYNQVCVCN